MRPFWIDFNIDGRKNNLTGGPKSKDGGLKGDIFVNINGKSISVLKIDCFVKSDKKKILITAAGEIIYEKVFD